MLEKLIDIDKKLFLFLNGFNSSFFDALMLQITHNLIWIPLYLLMIYWLFNLYKWRVVYILLLIGLTVAICDQVSVKLFKEVFQRLRPSHNEEFSNIIHLVNGRRGGLYGFVSSHAANTFGVATIISFFLNKNYMKYIVFSWALIVSYSRIYLGVHYPFDILGGALLGAGIGIAIFSGFKFYLYKTNRLRLFFNES